MARKKPRPPKARTARRPRSLGLASTIRTVLALLLLAGSGALLWWLAAGKVKKPADDRRRLEETVRHVLARVGVSGAFQGWETADDATPTLVVHVSGGSEVPVRRLGLELAAALHNAGGELEELPVLEKGGYGRVAYRGHLGSVRLRLVVVHEESPPPVPSPQARQVQGKLAIVLDDAGFSEAALAAIAGLPPEVAVAVLPNAPASAAVAKALRAQGRELLLHMPMEPEGNGSPGPGEGAIVVGLDASQVRQRLENALAVVGPVFGVNNHMGSRATSDPELMAHFMQALAGRGLYFLDSRTTPASVAEKLARQAGIPALRRDVFLDVVEEEGAVRSALATAASLARSQGRALAIGHVHPLTLRVLQGELPRLGGVNLVRPSALVKGGP
ncbi:MAG: divergent polysaccharide deacetylase family protein [Thermoanaerobaculum sp.]